MKYYYFRYGDGWEDVGSGLEALDARLSFVGRVAKILKTQPRLVVIKEQVLITCKRCSSEEVRYLFVRGKVCGHVFRCLRCRRDFGLLRTNLESVTWAEIWIHESKQDSKRISGKRSRIEYID